MPLWANYALLLLAVLIWGSLHPVSKLALAEVAPLQLAASRVTLAALVLIPLCMLTGRTSRLLQAARRAPGTMVLLGLLGYPFSMALSMVALTSVPAALNALFANSSPLFVALYALTLLKEKPSQRALAGIVLGFGGVVLLSLGGAPGGGALQPLAVGLSLTAAASWAAYSAVARRVLTDLDPMAVTALAAAAGAIPTLMAAVIWGGGLSDPFQASSRVQFLVLWVGLVATGVNFTIWAVALRRLRTVSVSAFQYMIPVVAMVIAAILLGDQPTPLVIAGAGLVLAGVAAAQAG
ncbi:MAG TPA: DMT family transporter [Chloroflexota bacterium]|jgi:drug/metabolite transporter (DMT)-like permease|nr:DMT family transporter [Chloroflexota bacterium]